MGAGVKGPNAPCPITLAFPVEGRRTAAFHWATATARKAGLPVWLSLMGWDREASVGRRPAGPLGCSSGAILHACAQTAEALLEAWWRSRAGEALGAVFKATADPSHRPWPLVLFPRTRTRTAPSEWCIRLSVTSAVTDRCLLWHC